MYSMLCCDVNFLTDWQSFCGCCRCYSCNYESWTTGTQLGARAGTAALGLPRSIGHTRFNNVEGVRLRLKVCTSITKLDFGLAWLLCIVAGN